VSADREGELTNVNPLCLVDDPRNAALAHIKLIGQRLVRSAVRHFRTNVSNIGFSQLRTPVLFAPMDRFGARMCSVLFASGTHFWMQVSPVKVSIRPRNWRLATLVIHIVDIVGSASQPKVLGVHARRIVAPVKNRKVIGDITKMNEVRHSMGLAHPLLRCRRTHSPIPPLVFRGSPQPTAVRICGFVDVLPETSDEARRESGRLTLHRRHSFGATAPAATNSAGSLMRPSILPRILLGLLIGFGVLMSVTKTADGTFRVYRDQNLCVLTWGDALVQVVDLQTCLS